MTKTTVEPSGIARRPASSAVAEAHAVERAGDGAGDRVPGAEVDPCVERGDDLAGVLLDAFLHELARLAGLPRVLLRRLEHPRIEAELVHEDLALRHLEGREAHGEPRVQLVDDAVRAPPHHGARGGAQHPVEDRPAREEREQDERPERHFDRGEHRNFFED